MNYLRLLDSLFDFFGFGLHWRASIARDLIGVPALAEVVDSVDPANGGERADVLIEGFSNVLRLGGHSPEALRGAMYAAFAGESGEPFPLWLLDFLCDFTRTVCV